MIKSCIIRCAIFLRFLVICERELSKIASITVEIKNVKCGNTKGFKMGMNIDFLVNDEVSIISKYVHLHNLQ